MTEPSHVGAVQAERAARVRRELEWSGLHAALLFRPSNVAFATGYDVDMDVGLGRPARCALVPVRGEPIIWEHSGVIRITAMNGASTHRRNAAHLGRLWVGDQGSASSFAGDIRTALSGWGLGDSVGIDEVSVQVYNALCANGIGVADASVALTRARSISETSELSGFAVAVHSAHAAMRSASARLKSGVRLREIYSALEMEAIDRGAKDWLMPVPRDRVVAPGDLVALQCRAQWEGGYFVHLAQTVACNALDAEMQASVGAISAGLDHVIDQVRPGLQTADLVACARTVIPRGWNAPQTDDPLLHGCGAGEEQPVAGWDVGGSAELQPGMVLSVGLKLGNDSGAVVHMRQQLAVTTSGHCRLGSVKRPTLVTEKAGDIRGEL